MSRQAFASARNRYAMERNNILPTKSCATERTVSRSIDQSMLKSLYLAGGKTYFIIAMEVINHIFLAEP